MVKKATKHVDQCVSHTMTKNTLYFGGLGQITDNLSLKHELNVLGESFCRHAIKF